MRFCTEPLYVICCRITTGHPAQYRLPETVSGGFRFDCLLLSGCPSALPVTGTNLPGFPPGLRSQPLAPVANPSPVTRVAIRSSPVQLRLRS